MSNLLKQLREDLELLPMGELRKRATSNFGIRLMREDTKEDVIDRIIGVASKNNFAEVAKGNIPEPGWSRIRVHPVPGKPQFPFYVGLNGYQCWIPFNCEVDVPHKIVALLNDAVEMRVSTDEFGNRKDTFELSYPFSLLAETPGPDPRPGMEVIRARKQAAKYAFQDKHGYWPSDKDLRDERAARSQAEMLKEVLNKE